VYSRRCRGTQSRSRLGIRETRAFATSRVGCAAQASSRRSGAFAANGAGACRLRPRAGGTTGRDCGLGKAVLLRHAGPGVAPTFDSTALVNLDGWGIRDVTVHWGWVWLIAGPVEDNATVAFKLWRLPLDALVPDRVIEPEFMAPLRNGAEGLAIDGSSAIVLMDGDEAGNGAASCRKNATYTVLRVPLPRR